MAHHKDAIKRIKQNEKRRLRNKSVRTVYRNRIKQVKIAVAAGDLESAQTALLSARRAIDQAVTKKVLHKNTAARYISRLSRSVNTLKSEKAA